MPDASSAASTSSSGACLWVPVFVMFINLVLSVQNGCVECFLKPLPGSTPASVTVTRLEAPKPKLLFACVSLGYQLLWKLFLRNPPHLLNHCVLNCFFLLAIPLGAILPWPLREVFLCMTRSWNASHVSVLFISLCLVVRAHCPPRMDSAAPPTQRSRQNQPLTNTPKQEARKITYVNSMQKHTPPSRPVPTYRTPSKLASDRSPPVQTNTHASVKLIREEIPTPNQTPAGSASILSVKTSFGKEAPGGGGRAAATGGGTVLQGKSSNSTDLPSTQRDIQPCGMYDGIDESGSEIQPPSEGTSTDDLLLPSNFWKKHELWGAVGEKSTFDDKYKTTEQPFQSTETIDDWLKVSCDSNDEALDYLKKQHVFKKILDSGEQGKLVKASEGLKAFQGKSSNSRKFYWLLLRLVYASSRLAEPSASWWYESRAKKEGEDLPPDNFCAVLQKIIQNIQESQKVFETRDDFDILLLCYIKGLINSEKTKAQQNDSIDWIRSRPLLVVQALLGVKQSQEKFKKRLEELRYEKDFEPPAMSESKTLEMGYRKMGIWKQAKVCVAMVPGGCIMKHPDALPPPDTKLPVPFKVQKDSDQPQILLQWFYWMHNARGSFNCVDPSPDVNTMTNFLRKNSTYIVYKKDLSDEVHSFFKQMWPEENQHAPKPEENTYQQDLMATVLFDRIGDKLIEDQSAQIFSGTLPLRSCSILSHKPADVIFKLLTDSSKSKECYGMALTVANLCIWRCDFKRNWPVRKPSEKDNDGFDVNFVKDRENHFMFREEKDLSRDNFDTEIMPMYSTNIRDCFYSGVAMEQLQVIAPHNGPDFPPYFHWYPSHPEFIYRSEHRFKRMTDKDLNGNLNWNSRVILMDLLLLFAENVRKETRDILTKLFPVKFVSNDYPNLGDQSALRIFFVHFWQPAFENFRKVFHPDAKIDEQDLNFAIGEICHVLGITCRTQWMQIGFFQVPSFDSYGEKGGVGRKHEYLPCRCERLLHVLPSLSRLQFVRDLAAVFQTLKNHYLREEVKISELGSPPPHKEAGNEAPECGGAPAPGQKCWKCQIDLQASYWKNTRHFKIARESFVARRCADNNSCEDPRAKTNVYLFALLDVS